MSFITDVTGLLTCLGSVLRPPRRPSACSSSTSHISRFFNSAIFAPFRSGRVPTRVHNKTKSTQSHSTIDVGMLGGPARTAQAQGSGRGGPEHETACYGGAYPFPDLKFRRGADPVFSAAPRELQRHLLVQASRTIVAHADNMLLLETVQIQSDASSAHRGTYLCSP